VKYKQGSWKKVSRQIKCAPKHLSLFVEQRGESAAHNKRRRLKEVSTDRMSWMGSAPLSFSSGILKSFHAQSRRQEGPVARNYRDLRSKGFSSLLYCLHHEPRTRGAIVGPGVQHLLAHKSCPVLVISASTTTSAFALVDRDRLEGLAVYFGEQRLRLRPRRQSSA